MAQKFLRAVGGNYSADASWSLQSGGTNNTTHPTIADDVVLDASSGQLTQDVASSCLSFTCTGYTGTFTWAGLTLTVGGNATFASGMTFAGTTSSSRLLFSASGTLITAGKIMVTTIASTVGTLTLGDDLNGVANHFGTIAFAGTLDMNGHKILGNTAVNRMFIESTIIGTPVSIVNATATSFTNTDFQDITFTSASDLDLSAITGKSGDAGGNSITGGGSTLTFTPSATQTSTGTASFTWSTHGWTTRVPLPQDDVVVSNSFIAGRTVTMDVSRAGRSITFAGMSGTPTVNATVSPAIFGSLTLNASMSLTGSSWIFQGRSSYNITTSGITFPAIVQIQCPGGTYTSQDALACLNTFNLLNGGYNSNGFTITSPTFVGNTGLTRSLTLGTSTWNLTSTAAGTIWNINVTTGMTFSGASATIAITTISANTRTFTMPTFTLGTLTYTVAGSTGELDISVSGSLSIGRINFLDSLNSRALKFSPGNTVNFTNTFNVNGQPGFIKTLSSTNSVAHTLSKSSGIVSCDYLNIANSHATGGATWYAGEHSINGGGNTGWIFTQPPVPRTLIPKARTLSPVARIIAPIARTLISTARHTIS